MDDVKLPCMAQALEAYGPNLYAQARATGIPYTTLRDWIVYGQAPPVMRKLARFPELLAAFAQDVAAQAEAAPAGQTVEQG